MVIVTSFIGGVIAFALYGIYDELSKIRKIMKAEEIRKLTEIK